MRCTGGQHLAGEVGPFVEEGGADILGWYREVICAVDFGEVGRGRDIRVEAVSIFFLWFLFGLVCCAGGEGRLYW